MFTNRLISCNYFTVVTVKGKIVVTEEEGKGCNASVSIFSQVRAHNVHTQYCPREFLYICTQGLHLSLAEVLLQAYFENIFNVIESKTALIALRRKKGNNGKIVFCPVMDLIQLEGQDTGDLSTFLTS